MNLEYFISAQMTAIFIKDELSVGLQVLMNQVFTRQGKKNVCTMRTKQSEEEIFQQFTRCFLDDYLHSNELTFASLFSLLFLSTHHQVK